MSPPKVTNVPSRNFVVEVVDVADFCGCLIEFAEPPAGVSFGELTRTGSRSAGCCAPVIEFDVQNAHRRIVTAVHCGLS